MNAQQQRRKELALSKSFVPRFWDHADGRLSIAKEIKRRYEELREDAGVDSCQKDLLCQRAIFIGVQLESMECVAAEEGKLDPGVYTQMSNALLGLLRALGLERRMKAATTLDIVLKRNGPR